jgi:scyllo-inositol 2-dehydrogenase (NADP+)
MSGRVFHAPFIHHHPGFALTGSWERSVKAISQYYESARSYDRLEDVLTDPAIDLVVVNTPTTTHYDFTRTALEHGKHVLVEKAFAGNAAEASELCALAKKQGRKLAVFQNRRWDSDFLSVQHVLKQGILGDIVEANLAWLRYGPELSPKSHKEVPSSGSGIVKDLGPHVIDQAVVLFGMPAAVFADIGITRERSRVDDYFDILLAYADKRVRVKGGYFYRHPIPEFTLFGKLGCFIKTRSDVQETQLQNGMTPDEPDYGREPDAAAGRLYTGDPQRTTMQQVASPRGNYLQFYEELYQSIISDRPEPVTATDGVRVMQIIDAAQQSAREGKVVTL